MSMTRSHETVPSRSDRIQSIMFQLWQGTHFPHILVSLKLENVSLGICNNWWSFPLWAVCKVMQLIINSVWGSMICGTFLQSESGYCVGKEPEWAGAEVREQLRALEQFQKVLHLDANLGGGGRWQGEGALRRSQIREHSKMDPTRSQNAIKHKV